MSAAPVWSARGRGQGQPDTGDIVAVHQMFRREVRALVPLISAAEAGDTARAALVGTHLALVLDLLQHQHEGEDDLLWPLLTSRCAVDPDLQGVVEVHHHELEHLIEVVRGRLQAWVVTGDPRPRDLLAFQLSQFGEVLRVHLDAAERFVLPLVREHLSGAEWSRVGAHGSAGRPRRRGSALILLGTILEDAAPAERASFWATVTLPRRVAWGLVGRRRHRRYRRRLWGAPSA